MVRFRRRCPLVFVHGRKGVFVYGHKRVFVYGRKQFVDLGAYFTFDQNIESALSVCLLSVR